MKRGEDGRSVSTEGEEGERGEERGRGRGRGRGEGVERGERKRGGGERGRGERRGPPEVDLPINRRRGPGGSQSYLDQHHQHSDVRGDTFTWSHRSSHKSSFVFVIIFFPIRLVGKIHHADCRGFALLPRLRQRHPRAVPVLFRYVVISSSIQTNRF